MSSPVYVYVYVCVPLGWEALSFLFFEQITTLGELGTIYVFHLQAIHGRGIGNSKFHSSWCT